MRTRRRLPTRHPLAPLGRRRRRPLLVLAALLLLGVLFVRHSPSAPVPAPASAGGDTTAAADPGPPPAAAARAVASPRSCSGLVAGLSVRDRLAQRLMVGVDPADPATTRAVVRRTHVGGIFIGGNATRILADGTIARIQAALPVPVAVAVDEEGGRVQRIDALAGSMPSAQQMGAMPPGQVRRIAAERGHRLAGLGVTVDMAPVVDIGGPSDDAVIGDRAFSQDPASIAAHAGAFAAGLRDAGVEPVFKHFPGHGRATGDSHTGHVTTPPLASLEAVDLQPYRSLVAGEHSAVMVGHLDVPGLTGGVPATLSAPAYHLLRQELGFSGVTITDDLGAMRAITDRYSLVQAVTVALRSGADIALWTSTVQLDDVLDHLVAETAAGRLPIAATDVSDSRIFLMKGLCDG